MLPQDWLLQLITQQQDKTVVKRLHLEPDNPGRWVVNLDSSEKAVIVESGLTRGRRIQPTTGTIFAPGTLPKLD